jgi:transcriptional regulator with XRE-family HTH domain
LKSRQFTSLLVKARKARKLTQGQACEVIGVADISTLSDWERGESIPSMKMISKIVEAYSDPMLGYIYLYECTEVGEQVLPPLPDRTLIRRDDLLSWTMFLQKEHNDISRVMVDLVEITCDGKIDKHEEATFNMVLKEIIDFLGVGFPLAIRYFNKRKNPSQDCSLVKGYI